MFTLHGDVFFQEKETERGRNRKKKEHERERRERKGKKEFERSGMYDVYYLLPIEYIINTENAERSSIVTCIHFC